MRERDRDITHDLTSVRQYFSKGTDLGAYDADHLAQIAKQLNDRPRRCLGWTTPAQQLAKLFPTVH